MILLDKNAAPNKTVVYLSAMIFGMICGGTNNINSIYHKMEYRLNGPLNYDLFILALDFLFLLDKISINKKGDLEVVY